MLVNKYMRWVGLCVKYICLSKLHESCVFFLVGEFIHFLFRSFLSERKKKLGKRVNSNVIARLGQDKG